MGVSAPPPPTGTDYSANSGTSLPTGWTIARTSSATYFDSSGVLQSAANDNARYTYDPVSHAIQGLLVEPSVTNQIRNNTAQGAVVATNGFSQPDDLSNAAWTKSSATIPSTNAANDSDGNATLDFLREDTTANIQHYVQQSKSVTNGVKYVQVCEVRANGRNAISILWSGAARWGSAIQYRFNLSAVTVTKITGPTSAAAFIENLGGGLYRCTVTCTCVSAGSSNIQIMLDTGSATQYDGDGVSGVYLGKNRWYDSSAMGSLPSNQSIGGFTGVSTIVTKTGILNGMEYVDLLICGIPSITFGTLFLESSSIISAVNGAAWTLSAYAALVAGTTTNLISTLTVRQQDSSGVTLTDLVAASITPTATMTRFGGVVTTNNASIAYVRPLIGFTMTANTPVNATLRIALPQSTQASSLSTPIKTTNAAVTRAVEALTVSGVFLSRNFVNGNNYTATVTYYDDTTQDFSVTVSSDAITLTGISAKPVKSLLVHWA